MMNYIMYKIGLEKVNFKDKSIKHLSSKFLKDFELDKNRIFINEAKYQKFYTQMILCKKNIFIMR